MATQTLAIGSNDTPSDDVTLAADAVPATFFLNDASAPLASKCHVDIYLKDAAARYFKVGFLNSSQPAMSIAAPGTYRFQRATDSAACGVVRA